jgi:Peptidase family M28
MPPRITSFVLLLLPCLLAPASCWADGNAEQHSVASHEQAQVHPMVRRKAKVAARRSALVTSVLVNATTSLTTFVYKDDVFYQTNNPAYASGARNTADKVLRVSLGGVDDTTRQGLSGGWRYAFNLTSSTSLKLSFQVAVTQTADYESDEYSQALVALDGAFAGQAPFPYVVHINGDGNGGSVRTSGYKKFEVEFPNVAAGAHTLVLGAYNNRKTSKTESTIVRYKGVQLAAIDAVTTIDPTSGPKEVVGRLSLSTFTSNVQKLAANGDRTQGSSSYNVAAAWVESQLSSFGYAVERHAYTYSGQSRTNLYVTKIGAKYPDRMFIVSAHLDGRGGGGAANDDGSGSSLVLELARVLGSSDVQVDVSIRMIFWNNEETGLNGSYRYVQDRAALQGIESPAGSGTYPEPTWIGMITHDQILFDHGTPAAANQSPNADADIEYQASSVFASTSQWMGNAMVGSTYAKDYPAEVSNNMCCTDSVPFQNAVPSVSVRENRRVAEMEHGSAPHWHQKTDVFATYTSQDFLFGFNIVQRTVGSVAQWSGLRVVMAPS